MDQMHDWTPIDVSFDWNCARASLSFEDLTAEKRILNFEGVRLLEIPRENEWGPSVSVNAALEEIGPGGTGHVFRIEMQSGDVIRVVAAVVTMT